MKKSSLAKKLIPLSVVLVLVIAGWGFVSADKKSIAPAPEKGSTVNQTETPAETGSEAKKTQTIDLSGISMPILMYHHIREYNFEKDEIGTQLSVSPSNFAKQLDEIKEKGYQTTTFHDLETGDMPTKPIILTFDDGYKNFYDNAYPELKNRGMKAVLNVIVNNIGKSGYATTDEILKMSKNDIEIGAHTLTHPDLTKISAEQARKEIIESKTSLESLTGTEVATFCYPGGSYNDSVQSLVREAGFRYATTTQNTLSTFDELLLIERYRVNKDTNISGYLKD